MMCSDCSCEYTEPLLVCPRCFEKILQTDDPRIKRAWIEVKPKEGETIEEYSLRISESLIRVGPHLTGFSRSKLLCSFLGDHSLGCGGTQEEREVINRPLRNAVSAAVCAAIKSWVSK